jgi:chemotaxis protein MotA
MPDPVPSKKPEKPERPVSLKKPIKSGGMRPDLATLVGIALALAGIVGGLLLEQGNILDIAQLTAAMIVLGGTFGAVLVSTPLAVARRALGALRDVFFETTISAGALAEELIGYATSARKRGIVSLEAEVANIPDPFLRKALGLAVDGAELQDLRNMMEIDLALIEQQGEEEAKVWEAAGGFAPTIGIIGAVMGLIQVMKHLEDIKVVGHGIAGAFVATLYGVGSANIFFLPAAAKLRARTRKSILIKELVLEGVAGISQGLNPTLIRLKLESYDRTKRPAAKGPAAMASSKKAPAAQTAPADKLGAAWKGINTPPTKTTNVGWSPTPIS